MAALVQGYPQQSGTVTILQTRPNTTSGIMAGTPQPQPGQQYGVQSQRNNFHGVPGNGGGQAAYRPNTTGPIQPYAFTSTPGLANNGQWQQQYGGYRGSTASSNQTVDVNSSRPSAMRQQSTPPTTGSNHPTFAQVAAAKASPERYRRPAQKHTDSSSSVVQQSSQTPGSAMPSGSGMATVVHLYNPGMTADRKAAMPRNSAHLASSRPHSAYASVVGASVDDIHVPRLRNDEDVKKFRRRSLHSIDFPEYSNPLTPRDFRHAGENFRPEVSDVKKASSLEKEQKSVSRVVPLPVVDMKTVHTRSGSSDSVVSSRSSNSRPSSSANRNSNVSAAPTTNSPASTSASGEKGSHQDYPKLVNVPPRSSSTDVSGKRILNPSPLSQPTNMTTGSSSGSSALADNTAAQSSAQPAASPQSVATSPAAQQLAAINEKGGRPKSKTSRLRRAFSFGSAAELRKVTGQDGPSDLPKATQQNEITRLHKDPRPEDLYEEEQARIAQKQEEGGIGSSIYSGTKLFSGSTDNLSISSTASSASIMLRKMGRGVKKGGRSLVGLFRPKSVIGSPLGDSVTMETSQAAVSMITVEAERERVNVNAQQDGGTGFPHLERNSIDAINPKSDSLKSDRPDSGNSAARKSIVGGERERAEVLATIRKGILKTRSDSPSPRPSEAKGPTFELPAIPNISDSPISSAPSTPNDEGQGHKRNGSIAIGNEDYFVSALRLRQDTKSAPVTPQGHTGKRNATFSPRIVFYDTWPPGEYDRRGDIATCNRLTPMLAQQIKEELNTFKMEMEVHETSKIYTHFF